jgi:ubiquitin-protein ligase E3 A
MSLAQKKKLLLFSTGSDRVPIRGLGSLPFTIQKHGPDSERLPSASTCFNILLLPNYSTKEKLQQKLLQGIEASEGFGLQ